MGKTTFGSPASIKRLSAMEAYIQAQPKAPSTKDIAAQFHLTASATAAYLRQLERDWRVHSSFGVRQTMKYWSLGPAPDGHVRVKQVKVVDEDKIDLPVRRVIKSTWKAHAMRDPLVAALFGQAAAAA